MYIGRRGKEEQEEQEEQEEGEGLFKANAVKRRKEAACTWEGRGGKKAACT